MKQRGPGTGKLSRYQKVIRSPGFDELGRAARAVLKDLWTIVADNAPDDDGNYTTRASNEYIGQWSGYSARSVCVALAELESAGFLARDGEGPARVIALRTAQFTTRTAQPLRSNCAEIDTQPRSLRHATAQSTTPNCAEIDIAYKEDKTSNTRPDTRPGTRGTPQQTTWLGVILPEGLTTTPEDDDAARKLAEHIRERYPSTRKIHHRPPVNQILRLAAPHLAIMAETGGTIADACEHAMKAVDAVAEFATQNPSRAGFVYSLERWVGEGGFDYEDPLDFMPHLRPKAEAKLTKMQEHEIGNHDERSWLDAG
jgi:hypothetical protein